MYSPGIDLHSTQVNIGSVQVFLQPVAYMVEMKEQLEITDLKGNKIGVMNVSKDLKYIVEQFFVNKLMKVSLLNMLHTIQTDIAVSPKFQERKSITNVTAGGGPLQQERPGIHGS